MILFKEMHEARGAGDPKPATGKSAALPTPFVE